MSDQQSVPYQPTRMSFTRQQVAAMTPAEYQQYREQIIDASRRGDIEDDITTPAFKANVAMQAESQGSDGQ